LDRYSVKKGDTLSIIAMKFYGDPSLWRRVYDANRSTIRNPNVVLPGQQLEIPTDMDVKNQRSMMSPSEQLRRPEEGLSYPLEFEAFELLIGATALLKGLLKAGVKVFSKKAAKEVAKEADDVFRHVIDPKSGGKTWPNSPYNDKTVDPRKMMEDINRKIEESMKAASRSNSIGKQNAEIQRIHKEFIETGNWPLKRTELGDYHSSTPDPGLMKARQDFLKALNEHKP